MNPQPRPAPHNPALRKTWNPWPASIIIFFAIAIVGCGVMVAFCSRHPVDLVAADYYEEEIRYQAQMDSIQRTQPASIKYDPAAKNIRISLLLPKSPTGATGSIQLYRPSSINLDQQFKLEPDANGVQTIDTSALSPGLWLVRVSWTVEKKDYFLEQRVVIGGKAS